MISAEDAPGDMIEDLGARRVGIVEGIAQCAEQEDRNRTLGCDHLEQEVGAPRPFGLIRIPAD